MSARAYGSIWRWIIKEDQRTIVPENAHIRPDLGAFSHHEMTLTLSTHTFIEFISCLYQQIVSGIRLQQFQKIHCFHFSPM